MKKTQKIETENGRIQGYIDKDIKIFKGIPYAEPPINQLRFDPPREREPWNNVCVANQFGVSSFQGPDAGGCIFGQLTEQQEDNCLTLNIWTPETDDKKRPVMLWIHGGGFIYSGSSKAIYDGTLLASKGNTVVVTINYRLGIFGFLYIPDITSNVGMLDQVAAIKWVKNNIANFGGDPDNITIFGESAGANSVITLMIMPSAKGLFHHAIAQSPYIFEPEPTLKTTKNVMKRLNIEFDDIDALKKLPAQKLNRVQNEYINDVSGTPESFYSNFRPSIDNDYIPLHPFKALKEGKAKDIDLLIGTNQDEATFFSSFNPVYEKLNKEGLKAQIRMELDRLSFGSKTDFFIEQYKTIRKGKMATDSIDIYNAIYTDLYYRIPAIKTAESHLVHNSNTSFYLLNWCSPTFKSACHSIDLPLTFGYINPIVKDFVGDLQAAKIVSNKMMDAWINFANLGDVNSNSIPEWPRYELKNRATMTIGPEFKVVEDPFGKERELWEDLYNDF
ncbi:MAG: carboxylesterase/lipase family protein [Promethearchaeota archaeon]